MTLYLSRSRPRNAFKNLLGNANHLIITALVGLDAVERGIVREVPEDLRTAWSPKNAVSSATRSRRLILDMALIRAIDAVDVYLREAFRKPALIQSNEFRRELDAANLSIFQKMQAVERNCPNLDSLPLAMIFLMIAWRNRSAHSEADRDAPPQHLEVLRTRADELKNRFRGLDAEKLLEGYSSMRPVTFKEVASLINAAHHLVADLDQRLLVGLDVERFVKDAVWFSMGADPKPAELVDQTRMRRAVNVWGKDRSDRGSAIIRLLNQHGFSTFAPLERVGSEVPAELIETLQEQTPKSVLAWAHVAD
ncbi:hypothetical protein [Mesorhizobium sp. BR1-1-2]|uniref:hypothetical protein n=1 Tax=Mesorhizobium sp. BR1-1-2 TaxID=2876652 RepID=UPI001CC937DF|nr:hypothetical protein [Mesorhizobium sp. BR1-1-2]MBZ9962586.1 hypothetical protein [Mesorhizobium sp. BR1-1-2]